MTRRLGPESARAYQTRLESGFIDKYLSGDAVLDIGYRGEDPASLPITDKAIGVELDYPGYDGTRLPFADGSQDAVFVSHCLEHIADFSASLADWYRVLRVGGFLVIAVPHQYLYERKAALPSRFNRDHKRFYTPASLLAEVERSIPLDGYRVRLLRDNDDGFDYDIPPGRHATGCYEIELVIEKIARPVYGARIGWSRIADLSARLYAEIVLEIAQAEAEGREQDREALLGMLNDCEPPPFMLIREALAGSDRALRVLRDRVAGAPFDVEWYARKYPDVAMIVAQRGAGPARAHYVHHGYFEGRLPRPPSYPNDCGSMWQW